MSIQSAIIAVQEKGENIRTQIKLLLEENPDLTAKEIQNALGLGKEVYYHLKKLGIDCTGYNLFSPENSLLKEKNERIVKLRMDLKNSKKYSKGLENQVLELDKQLERIDRRDLGLDKELIEKLHQRKSWEAILEENKVFKTTKIGQKTIAALDHLTRYYEERIPKSRQRKADGWNIFAPSLEDAKQLFRDYIACEQERLPEKPGWTAPSPYWALGGYYLCALSVLFVEKQGKEMVFFTKKRQKQILRGVAEGEGHTEYYDGMVEELKDAFRYANALIRNRTQVDWKKTSERLAKELAKAHLH